MSHFYAGYPRQSWNFFCDCPRPDINKSLISIGVFNFWALLFQNLPKNSSQDGFPKQAWGQDGGWRGCDSGDGGQVLSRNWLQVEKQNLCSDRERRERLAALAAETIDLAKDPYFMR